MYLDSHLSRKMFASAIHAISGRTGINAIPRRQMLHVADARKRKKDGHQHASPRVTVLCRALRCGIIPYLISRSTSLLCGDMPGYAKNVNRFGMALKMCVLILSSLYAAAIAYVLRARYSASGMFLHIPKIKPASL